jgi:hypothetical protein
MIHKDSLYVYDAAQANNDNNYHCLQLKHCSTRRQQNFAVLRPA